MRYIPLGEHPLKTEYNYLHCVVMFLGAFVSLSVCGHNNSASVLTKARNNKRLGKIRIIFWIPKKSRIFEVYFKCIFNDFGFLVDTSGGGVYCTSTF